MRPKRAGIVIDDWKLPVFEEHLTAAGFEYEKMDGPTKGCISLFVTTRELTYLGKVVQHCQNKAAELKG